MQPEEYERLSRVERDHWFYRGKREIVRHWINRTMALTSDSLLLDCGAGTGLFAREMLARCHVLASDDHEDSLQLLRRNLGPEKVIAASCTDLPLPSASVDCLTALDVLEHVEDDRKAVAQFAKVLKPGGVAIVTVPALQSLWSDWDVVLHHFRRYDKSTLKQLLDQPTLSVVHLAYINVLALPAIFLMRKWRGFFPARNQNATRIEEYIPPPIMNTLLRQSFVALACQRSLSFPAGVGLLAVVRREPGG
jgi:ubiquinone/menaquinone biosynthesis C-methylase UbiE